ncbi:ATP-binding protein [Clostridium diolis]|uniref:ATP-binding protein n=1 Tax=Clostridium diolis TaxID=223919 RepID=UPI003AF8652D
MQYINNQVAKDNSTINNVEKINNIIYDNPLKFFCDKQIQKNPDLLGQVQVIHYITNNDILKKRFRGDNFKYEGLAEALAMYNHDKYIFRLENLDDGYKSIIQCLAITSSCFILEVEENNEYLSVKGEEGLVATIVDSGLNIKYSKAVDSYEKYVQAKQFAETIINKLGSYINCATQYGNFFQFNNVYIEEPVDMPFIAKEVKFKVSNNIIPNLIKPLYGDAPECGLREIIQNACDACKEMIGAKSISNIDTEKEPIVELHINYRDDNWEVRVRDYGIGMDENILLEKYFIIGESSKKNKNLNLVGQFGIGALAAFLLGDEVTVKTRRVGSDMVYSFQYQLENDQNRNIGINKNIDRKFEYGTEVVINLNRKYNSINDIEEKLKINEWYVMSNILIEYYFNNRMQKIRSFKTNEYQWNTLIDDEELKVEYLESENNELDGKAIYNGIAVLEPYILESKYIRKRPCINITTNNNKITLNLERSRIKEGQEIFTEQLRKKLINVCTSNFANIVHKDIIHETGEINKFTYYNDKYFKSLPMFFCREGVGFYSKLTVSKLSSEGKYDTIVRVYGYNSCRKININSLQSNAIYIFDNDELKRKEIGDLIECSGVTYIPIEKIKKFFYTPTDQYNGFRKEVMRIIYNSYDREFPENNTANDFWKIHNTIKEQLFKEFLSEPGYKSIGNFEQNNFNITEIQNICTNSIIKIAKLNSVWFNDIIDENIDVGIVQ